MVVLRRVAVALVAVVALGACASHGPWTDPSGNIASGGIIVEYDGFRQCGTQDVIFLEYVGRTYAKDLTGALGTLTSPSGAALTYSDDADLPGDAVPSGYRHEVREVWVAQSNIEDYLYVVYDDQRAERWPRAEIPCE
jgi:hypothetical protein